MAGKGTVGQLLVEMRAELGGLRTDVKEMENVFKGSFANIQNQAVALGRSLASAFGIGLGVGALVSFGKNVVNLSGQLTDLSAQTGIAASQLMLLKPIVENNGTSIDVFANAVSRLQIQIGQIQDVSDPAYKALQQLGINFNEIAAAKPDQAFKMLIEALDKVNDSAQRDALAFVFLGRLYTQVKASLPEITKAFGNVDESLEKQIAKLDEYGDKWNSTWNSILKGTTSALGFIVTETEKAFDRLIEQIRDLKRRAGIGPEFEASVGHFAEGGFRVNPETGDFGPSSHTEAINRTVGDKEAEQKAKAALDMLQKLVAATQAEKMALTLGADAAEKWKLEHQLMAELGVSQLSPVFQKLVNQISQLKGEIEGIKAIRDAYKDLFKTLDENEDKTIAAAKAFGDLEKEIRRGGMSDTEAELEKINTRWNEAAFGVAQYAQSLVDMGVSADEAADRVKPLYEMIDRFKKEQLSVVGGRNLGPFNELRAQVDAMNIPDDFSRRVFELTKQFSDLAAKIQEAGRAAGASQEQIDKVITSLWTGIQRQIQDASPATRIGERLGEALTDGIRNTLQGIETGQTSIGEGMKNLVRNMGLELQFALLDESVLAPIKSFVKGFAQGLFQGLTDAFQEEMRKSGESLGKMFRGWLDDILGSGGPEQLSGPSGGSGGLGGLFSSAASWIGSFFFDQGGPIPSFAGGGLFVGHGGEYVMQRSAVEGIGAGNMQYMNDTGKLPSGGGASVVINGDIIPRQPNMTKQEVIQVMTDDAYNRGPHFQMSRQQSRG